MFRSYRVGTLFGFPIEVNLSFLLILGLIVMTTGLLQGVLFVTIIFGSVLLHELGHSLVARHLGVPIAGIELHFFGGAAKMIGQPKTANDEVAIALAGPAVSFMLGGLGIGLAAVTGAWFVAYIGWINLILGTFNMFPALPMDGGRVFRALLTRKYSFVHATQISVFVTRGFAILLAAIGIATLEFYLPFLAVLIWFLGANELKLAHMIGGMFTYNSKGYLFQSRGYDSDVEVLPADFWGRPGPGASGRSERSRPPTTGGTTVPPRFVLRQRGGRWYIEPLP